MSRSASIPVRVNVPASMENIVGVESATFCPLRVNAPNSAPMLYAPAWGYSNMPICGNGAGYQPASGGIERHCLTGEDETPGPGNDLMRRPEG